jgi:hypothetical protein
MAIRKYLRAAAKGAVAHPFDGLSLDEQVELLGEASAKLPACALCDKPFPKGAQTYIGVYVPDKARAHRVLYLYRLHVQCGARAHAKPRLLHRIEKEAERGLPEYLLDTMPAVGGVQ